jgi:hypothetical protein
MHSRAMLPRARLDAIQPPWDPQCGTLACRRSFSGWSVRARTKASLRALEQAAGDRVHRLRLRCCFTHWRTAARRMSTVDAGVSLLAGLVHVARLRGCFCTWREHAAWACHLRHAAVLVFNLHAHHLGPLVRPLALLDAAVPVNGAGCATALDSAHAELAARHLHCCMETRSSTCEPVMREGDHLT